MDLRRVAWTGGVNCLIETGREPVLIEASFAKPEEDTTNVLRSGKPFDQLGATPPHELDSPSLLVCPPRPLGDVFLPAIHGRFPARQSGIRAVERDAYGVTDE